MAYEDANIRVLNEGPQGPPVAVIKRHDDLPNVLEYQLCRKVREKLFPGTEWDDSCEDHPNHWHVYLR